MVCVWKIRKGARVGVQRTQCEEGPHGDKNLGMGPDKEAELCYMTKVYRGQ